VNEAAASRWLMVRRLVTFVLGVAVIVDALWEKEDVVAELVIGLILVGVLPIEDLIRLLDRRGRR
jgi:hypothetical protein